ncbi:MAG: 4-carboxymuconolactone decarboxylase [Phaeospirillum sp.]|nr:4-carboxymuconolactone decarboxylase [Phaeospirillum sp.]
MDDDLYRKGQQTRREILGDAHADRVAANLDDATRPFQDLITRYGWGEVWSRPGLDRRTRSMLTLAMLTALNRPAAIKLHLRGALNNGVTEAEIVEVLLQAAIYCGAPAAEESLRLAREIFAEPQDG